MVSSTVKNCISEFLGTFILVATVGANVLTGSSTWAVLSIASSLMVAWAETKGYEYQWYLISVFGLVLGCIEANFCK